MPLSDRQNFLRNASFAGPEWIPSHVHISGATWNELGVELDEVLLRHPVLFPGYEKRQEKPTPAPCEHERYTDAWGCVWQQEIDGLAGIVVEHPLDDWSKLDDYVPPDSMVQGERDLMDWDAQRKRNAEAKQKGQLTSGGVTHGFLFMRLYYLRGFENLMMDFATGEPRLHRLIEMIVKHTRTIVDQYLSMGIDVMEFADDLGTQTASVLSPEMFHKWITPAYKEVMQPCREAGCQVGLHSDGHTLELTDEFIEAGVTITNPQDLVNGIDNLAREVKGRMCIRLDIDRQSIIPYGTGKEIHDLIEEEVRKLGSPDGGMELIAGIYPPTPPENIDALCSAIEELRTWWWDGRGG